MPINFDKAQKEIIATALEEHSGKAMRRRILGCAGPGKTTVIAYCARELAKRGKRVLVCCYNKTLIPYIDSMIGLDCSAYQPRKMGLLRVTNYHAFMFHFILDYNGKNQNASDIDLFRKKEYFEKEDSDGFLLPEKYNNFAKNCYDYIFVDEMQDLKPTAVPNLIKFLPTDEGSSHYIGALFVFADKYQKIYDKNEFEKEDNSQDISIVPKIPKGCGFSGTWKRLKESHRSNSKIQRKARLFAKKHLTSKYGKEEHALIGDIIDSNIIYYEQGWDYQIDIKKLISKILQKSGWDVKNTAVLFSTKQEVCEYVKHVKSCGENAISTNECGKQEDELRRRFYLSSSHLKISTVKSFKGLEIDNIILVIDVTINLPIIETEELYVGLTRAKRNLAIINNNIEFFKCLNEIYGEYMKPTPEECRQYRQEAVITKEPIF